MDALVRLGLTTEGQSWSPRVRKNMNRAHSHLLSRRVVFSFDDVRAILFIVNLAGFNQVLFEDTAKNRMYEELELFEQITHNQLFASVPIFLFLNKVDLFEQMVSEIDMKKTFAEYSGGKAMDPALSYVMVSRERSWQSACCCSCSPSRLVLLTRCVSVSACSLSGAIPSQVAPRQDRFDPPRECPLEEGHPRRIRGCQEDTVRWQQGRLAQTSEGDSGAEKKCGHGTGEEGGRRMLLTATAGISDHPRAHALRPTQPLSCAPHPAHHPSSLPSSCHRLHVAASLSLHLRRPSLQFSPHSPVCSSV